MCFARLYRYEKRYDAKANHPEVERHRIAAFRNVLVHNYLGIDVESTWEITQRDVPQLKQTISDMLQSRP
jgi:uncharacterized protein with HEPN domain